MAKQNWRESLAQRQQELKLKSLWRRRRTVASAQQPFVQSEGEWRTNFSSNDYLGFAAHPALADAVSSVVDHWGVGSGASHLVCGHQTLHHQFEEELADFVSAERALLFSTGYMANLALGSALLEPSDLALHDRLNHASLLDGAQLSGAQFKRYAHCDIDHAERRLLSSDHSRVQIVTDGLFSMDGDLAPLTELALLASSHDAMLCVDDAHGFGVLGEGGRGTLSEFGLKPAGNVIMVGTLGKALGSFGAFIAGDAWLIEQLIQSARSYIYTTALPPTVVAAGRAALGLLKRQHEDLHSQLQCNIEQFRAAAKKAAIPLLASRSPIQPVMIGDENLALSISASLHEHGFLVPAIRTPTVRKGEARLRVTLTAAHTEHQIAAFVNALQEVSAEAVNGGALESSERRQCA